MSASTMAPSLAVMAIPTFRKDKSATEEFSRQYTNIFESDRSDNNVSSETASLDCQAQLVALLTTASFHEMQPSSDHHHHLDLDQLLPPPLSPASTESPSTATECEPSDELMDLFNLTIEDILHGDINNPIDDILHKDIASPIAMDSSDLEDQQRLQQFVFSQDYLFAADTVDPILVHDSPHMSSSSYPSPAETTASSPMTPNLDWSRSPSPSPSMSPIMDSRPKFEPYPAPASPASSLRRASISSTCSSICSSSSSSTAGPIKSRSYRRRQSCTPKSTSASTTTTSTTTTTASTTTACSQAHVKPRRRNRAKAASTTALAMESKSGVEMVGNEDGSITVFNPATEELSYRCALCPEERFGRIHDYKRHQLSKHQERVWPCDFCHRPFVRRDALLRHYAVKSERVDKVHPTKDQVELLREARARARLIG